MSEQETEKLSTKRCRSCLRKESNMIYIHDVVEIASIEISLAQAISLCTSIEISVDDLMPQHLCKICRKTLFNAFEFRVQCEKTDQVLRADILRNASNIPTKDVQIRKNIDPHHEQINTEITDPLRDLKSEVDEDCDVKDYIKDSSMVLDNVKLEFCEPVSTEAADEAKAINVFDEECEIIENITKELVTEQGNPVENGTCDLCGKQFKTKASLQKHKKRHKKQPRTCKYCKYIPESPAKLAQHMEEEHQSLKTIVCQECGKTFFREANLRLHLLVHSGVKSHTCEVCGLSFALSGNLKAHLRLHTGEKPYTCFECGKGFAQHSALRSHLINHTDKRDYKCSDCGAEFRRKGALRIHKERHQDSRPYKCSVCEKAFKTKSQLKRHEHIHTGIQDHVCHVCGKAFNRRSTLKVHERTHTGETPHICPICSKGFSQAHCLRYHLKAVHKQTVHQ